MITLAGPHSLHNSEHSLRNAMKCNPRRAGAMARGLEGHNGRLSGFSHQSTFELDVGYCCRTREAQIPQRLP